jgi:hypothetical protein
VIASESRIERSRKREARINKRLGEEGIQQALEAIHLGLTDAERSFYHRWLREMSPVEIRRVASYPTAVAQAELRASMRMRAAR